MSEQELIQKQIIDNIEKCKYSANILQNIINLRKELNSENITNQRKDEINTEIYLSEEILKEL